MPSRHEAASPSPKTLEIRNQLAQLYLATFLAIAAQVAQSALPCFEQEDLAQIAYLFLLQELAPAVDRYIRKRAHGKMRDLVRSKSRAHREAMHLSIEDAGAAVEELRDSAATPEMLMIDRQKQATLQSGVDQIRHGRPRKIVAAKMRHTLARAA